MAQEDSFQGEDVIITFEKEDSGSINNFEARITNMNLTGGTAEVDTIRTFGGNSIQVPKPTSDYEVKIEYVTRDSLFRFMQFSNDSSGNFVAGTEYRSGDESNAKRFRIIIWFIGGNNAGTAQSGTVIVPLKVGELMRYIFKDCFAITNEEDFSADEFMKGTLTFKTSPTDEVGKGNVFTEWTSAETTTALTVLNTTAHKGLMTWNTTTPAWTPGTTSTRYRVD